MMLDNFNEIEQLRIQVEREGAHTERECASHLKNLASVLLPISEGTITYIANEQLCSAGRVDMVVIAEAVTFGGETQPCAYVWELKAPQFHLFFIDTDNRACPTDELFKAENQLLHYHDSISKDGAFLERWRIVSSDDVKFGGIIMGRDHAIVDPRGRDYALARPLAIQAQHKREVTFYNSHNIRLWTWERVLSLLESQTLSHRKFTGDAKIDVRDISLSGAIRVDTLTSEVNLEVKEEDN
jgi:hypothetical protein